MKKKEIKEELERYKSWYHDSITYSHRMIRTIFGKMPIVVDPLSPIQYLDVISNDAIREVKDLKRANGNLTKINIVEAIVIICLFLAYALK